MVVLLIQVHRSLSLVSDKAEAYCDLVGIEQNLTPSNSTFVFGDQKQKSMGKLNIILPTPKGNKAIDTHVVPARIPFLVGLDTLDKYGWNVLTVQNKLQSVHKGWSLPLSRKFGHVFVTWEPEYATHYTRQQLQNMHLHFMHPSTTKLLNLLERAYPDQIKDDTNQGCTGRYCNILPCLSDLCVQTAVVSSKISG